MDCELFCDVTAGALVAEVDREGKAVNAMTVDQFRCQRLQPLFAAGNENDIDAFCGELLGKLPAYSGRCASHQGPGAFEIRDLELHRDVLPPVRWSATRRAFAMMVSAGLVPPLDGKNEASMT